MLNKIKDILQLPDQCLVNKKITKAFFRRNFDLTNAERNLLDEFTAVTAIDWIASISQHTANVPKWADGETTYEELQLVCVTTTTEGFERNSSRIIDLVQKYIPYHMLLVVSDGSQCIWNATYKRINQNDDNKRTIENKLTSLVINNTNTTSNQASFYEAMAFSRMNTTNLKTLYDGYVQCIVALSAAVVIGKYTTRPIERTKQDVAYLNEINDIEKEIVLLSNLAKKENQMSRRIDLNNQVQQKRKQIEKLKQLISA